MVVARWNAQVALETLVQVVAGLCASREEPCRRERAEDFLGPNAALHREPEEVELCIVDDHLDRFQCGAEFSQVVAGCLEVDQPWRGIESFEGEKANVAPPWVECVFLGRSVGFDVEGDGTRFPDLGGHVGKPGRMRKRGCGDVGGCFSYSCIGR